MQSNIISKNRQTGNSYAIGSVKSNIVHLEAAAGIIKTAIMLKNRELVASINYQKPNPYIDFDNLKLHIQTKNIPWQSKNSSSMFFAGVSSFGIGGTNAHVLLQSSPVLKKERNALDSCYPLLHPISVETPLSLKKLVKYYIKLLKQNPQNDLNFLQNICYSACFRRNHFKFRLSIIFFSKENIIKQLELFYNKKESVQILKEKYLIGNKRNNKKHNIIGDPDNKKVELYNITLSYK